MPDTAGKRARHRQHLRIDAADADAHELCRIAVLRRGADGAAHARAVQQERHARHHQARRRRGSGCSGRECATPPMTMAPGQVQRLRHRLRAEAAQDDILQHGADADGGDEDLGLEIARRQHGPRGEMIDQQARRRRRPPWPPATPSSAGRPSAVIA